MTRYCLAYQPRNGTPANYTSFGSALARALFIIEMGDQADLLRTWEAQKTDRELLADDIARMVAELPAVRERIRLEREQREAREAKS